MKTLKKKEPIYPSNGHLLIHILQYLPYKQVVKSCSVVSKHWRFYSTHRWLWVEFIRQQLGYEITEYENAQDYKWWKLYKELCQSSWKWRRAVSCFNIFDEHFRGIILGDKKVGKTGLLFRLTRTKFEGEEALKRGISKFEMGYKTTRMRDMVTNQTLKLQIYDTNMEDMASYVKACNTFLSLSHVVIITFSVNKKASFFNAIQKWLYLIKKRNSDNYVIVLVGTNIDKPKRQVTYEEAIKVAKENGIYYTEISNMDKTDFTACSIIQLITNATYRKFIEKKEPFQTSELIKTLENDKDISLVRKKQVLLIPSPEKIDMTDYGFESDGEKEQKKDLDEIRLQEYLSRLKQEEEEDDEIKKSFLSKSPRPSYVKDVETASFEDMETDPQLKKTKSSNEMVSEKKDTTETLEPTETTESQDKDEDQEESDELDLTEWNEENDWEIQEEIAFAIMNDCIPKEDQMTDFDNDFIHPKQEEDETQKIINEVLGNYAKMQKPKVEETIKFLTFDPPEKVSYDKQILQFAKKLRDDKELNDKLTTEEKSSLKNAVRVCYDFLTKNPNAKDEHLEKLQTLQNTVNTMVTKAFNKK